MTPLYEVATRALNEVFDDEKCFGVPIVVASREVDRQMLIAWTLATFPGKIDPGNPFKGLLITDQPDHLEWLGTDVLRRRLKRWRDTPSLHVAGKQDDALPDELPCFTLTTYKTFMAHFESVATQGLNLLILDEYHLGSMATLREFVNKTQPDLTIFLTKQPLPPGSPWRNLGKPLVLNRATYPEQPTNPRKRSCTRSPRRTSR